MGEYWKPVNVTKMESINPHSFGNGLKFREWVGYDSATMLKVRELVKDRWAGDLVVCVSDYGGIVPFDMLTGVIPDDLDAERLYDEAADISEQVGGRSRY